MANSVLDVFDKMTVVEDFARSLERAEILNCQVNMENKTIDVVLRAPELLSKEDLFSFADGVKHTYGLKAFEIETRYDKSVFSPAYCADVLRTVIYRHPSLRAFLSEAQLELKDGELRLSGVKGNPSVVEQESMEREVSLIIREETELEFQTKVNFENCTEEEFAKRVRPLEEQALKKAAEIHVTPIRDLREGKGMSVIEGRVLFGCEEREIRGGRRLITFDLADEDWGVSCKAMGRKDELSAMSPLIKQGNRLRVFGTYATDDFTQKRIFQAKKAVKLDALPIRQDCAEEKRVELHLHTKMSAMDGITSATDLINRAAEWGHSAIAITDHGVAQAFPEAHAAAGKIRKSGKEFKVIYGMEGYLVDDEVSAVRSAAAEGISGTYVVFDIETTGLSAETDMITEFGAVLVENGVVKDTFAQLVNPQRPIPPKITELTGISDAMVADKPTIEEVLPKFLEFCADHTVVAHNAKFDTGFVRVLAARQNLPFENKILDTLAISRELYPDVRSHKLDVIAKRLDISLDNHHRAVDDATATALIFIKFMKMIAEREQEQEGVPADKIDVSTNPELIKQPYYHIILLVKDYVGLKNLYRLISKSNIDYFYKKPRIPKSVLRNFREGILLGSACESGELFRAIAEHQPAHVVEKIADFYDYLEIQPIGNNEFMVRSGDVADDEGLRELNRRIVELGDKLGKQVVATCDVHFMDPEDEVYRRVLNGSQGFRDADFQAPLYFRTTDEMLEEFSYLGKEKAYELVVTNPNAIAAQIEEIQPVKDGSYPPSIENCEQDLADMCRAKAHEIYGDNLPKIVEERMERELDCILKYGYSVMYMIAHKLVKKSNEAGYLVGSRGSVGSSFVAFLSGITEVNALCPHYICSKCKHSEFFDNGEYQVGMDMPDKVCPECGEPLKKDGLTIPFETFLGFKGDKVPDIDLNFSGEYQATAHKYVGELFGEEFVFKAGTIGTIADKTAMGLARKYYELKEMIVPEAEIKRVAEGMIDVKRTTGQHPGGIIVCPKTMDIHDFCPIQHPADKKESGVVTTHFDFHSIHDNLLKLDILGHDDPSTIRMLEDLTGLDATTIPMDDKKTMSIFSSTEAIGVTPKQIDSEVGTFGVPEFGTSFVRGMLVDTKPTTFFELLIISGLSHGTDVWLNNAQDLIKEGTATLSEVIGLRDDIMVYLIHKGLEPGTAFKIMEFVRKGRAAKEGMPEEFEQPMKENNVPQWYIDSCKKIKYMFPKAHAAAYVMMAFRVAYFKVYYPTEFYIAYYTVRADLFDAEIMAQGKERLLKEMDMLDHKPEKLTANEKSLYTIMELCREQYERGIEFLPVDLYKSDAYKFQKVGNAILPPLNAFAGIARAAADSIVEARQNGPFLSQEDLKQRAKLNKSVIETLKENGCLDSLSESNQVSLFDLGM
uniref:DNA polymerase III PolC-type n=1 Tax=uncultured Bacillota bacterium TaxID=344338 RepID=A0A650EPL2_9FIRM|nr:DNA polymerase III PolC-type [uncultured Firmicutes bacterium]